MVNKLQDVVAKKEVNYLTVFSSLNMASNHASQNVFFVDQMARAFLVCGQVLASDFMANQMK